MINHIFTIRSKIKFILDKSVRIFAFPLAIFVCCLRPWIKIRFVPISCLTIGHYSLSIEVLLCKLDQNKNNKGKEIIIYLQRPKSQVCNIQLYKMWKRVIPISPDILYLMFAYIELYLEHWFGIHPYRIILGHASHDRWDILETSRQHLYFTKDELVQGEHILVTMGVPKNAKYVCLIVRDEAHYSTNNIYTKMSGFRNSDILHYRKAALFLAEKGYYVIRMGKTVNKAFDVNHKKIIDYACSNFRSDFMDIYLSAHCYFFMSTLCGLDGIAHAFRRPILATNITPNGYCDLGYPVKVFLAKKIIDNQGHLLTFKKQSEIFNRGSIEFINQMLKEHELNMFENTEDELLEATKEMLLRMQGTWCDTELSNTLQNLFWASMAKEKFYPDNQGILTPIALCKYKAKYCTDDLLNNRTLLEDMRDSCLYINEI